jgi:hypothetical protein
MIGIDSYTLNNEQTLGDDTALLPPTTLRLELGPLLPWLLR